MSATMRRYTTPSRSFRMKEDLDGCRVWLTLSQGRMRQITFDVTDTLERVETAQGAPEEWRFSIRLGQLDTARFKAGRPVEVQANWIDSNGYRGCSKPAELAMGGNLLERKVTRNG